MGPLSVFSLVAISMLLIVSQVNPLGTNRTMLPRVSQVNLQGTNRTMLLIVSQVNPQDTNRTMLPRVSRVNLQGTTTTMSPGVSQVNLQGTTTTMSPGVSRVNPQSTSTTIPITESQKMTQHTNTTMRPCLYQQTIRMDEGQLNSGATVCTRSSNQTKYEHEVIKVQYRSIAYRLGIRPGQKLSFLGLGKSKNTNGSYYITDLTKHANLTVFLGLVPGRPFVLVTRIHRRSTGSWWYGLLSVAKIARSSKNMKIRVVKTTLQCRNKRGTSSRRSCTIPDIEDDEYDVPMQLLVQSDSVNIKSIHWSKFLKQNGNSLILGNMNDGSCDFTRHDVLAFFMYDELLFDVYQCPNGNYVQLLSGQVSCELGSVGWPSVNTDPWTEVGPVPTDIQFSPVPTDQGTLIADVPEAHCLAATSGGTVFIEPCSSASEKYRFFEASDVNNYAWK